MIPSTGDEIHAFEFAIASISERGKPSEQVGNKNKSVFFKISCILEKSLIFPLK